MSTNPLSGYRFDTFNHVHPAALYIIKVIKTKDQELEPIEREMLDDAGLICEDGTVDVDSAKKHVDLSIKKLGE